MKKPHWQSISIILFCLSVNLLGYNLPDEIIPSQQAVPSGRRGHCLVYDENLQKIVLLDGYKQPDLPEIGNIWSFDGKAWKLVSSSGPSSRTLSGAVFDSKRKKLVLFGGTGALRGYEDLRGDTWEWNGKIWEEMSDKSVGTRDHHVMVYDPVRSTTIMYGGFDSNRKFVTDTWEWDGIKWTKISVPGPGGRYHFAMAYDNRHQQVVLFGGGGEDNRLHNDTWTWNGTNWKKVSETGPPPRARHRMAYDNRTGVIILFGGTGTGKIFDDTWMWDGKQWTEIKVKGPEKRSMHAMAYDKKRNRIVLYGGTDGEIAFADTWEWNGKNWEKIN